VCPSGPAGDPNRVPYYPCPLIYCSDPSIFFCFILISFLPFTCFVCLSIIASKWHYRNLTIALTCVKKHHELFYVFWHGRNGHLYCKGQQTSEPSVLKKNSINKYSRKGQNFSLVFGNLHLLGMQLLIILLQTKNL